MGKVYRRLMEIKSRLLPCDLHTIGMPFSAEEAITTLINIAGIDRPEKGIEALLRIIAKTLSRNIEELSRSANFDVLSCINIYGTLLFNTYI